MKNNIETQRRHIAVKKSNRTTMKTALKQKNGEKQSIIITQQSINNEKQRNTPMKSENETQQRKTALKHSNDTHH